jgi:hypothetical protein
MLSVKHPVVTVRFVPLCLYIYFTLIYPNIFPSFLRVFFLYEWDRKFQFLHTDSSSCL